EERPGLPVDLGPVFLRLLGVAGPHVGVALAAEEDDVVARAVAVVLLVRADRELAHVRHHRVVRELEADVLPAGAALLPFLELEAADVGDEVRLPHAPGVQGALAVEVLLATVAADGADVGETGNGSG